MERRRGLRRPARSHREAARLAASRAGSSVRVFMPRNKLRATRCRGRRKRVARQTTCGLLGRRVEFALSRRICRVRSVALQTANDEIGNLWGAAAVGADAGGGTHAAAL